MEQEGEGMTICVTCYRLFENARGFEDYEGYHKWDAEFESFEEAVFYMHDKCGYSSGEQAFVFDVEILETVSETASMRREE